MTNLSKTTIHWSFWLVGGTTLVYNMAGSINFFMQMNADAVAGMPESYRSFIEGRPGWATGTFAIAVIGGALGCVALLLRKSVAYYVFVASLVAAIGTMVQTLDYTAAYESPLVIGNMVQIVVATFLIWYTKRAENRGWL